MRLGYAFLARYAESAPDQTLTVVGGDFDKMGAPGYPTALLLAVVVKVVDVVTGAEDRLLTITLDVVGPDDVSVLDAPVRAQVAVKAKEVPESVRLVLNLGPVLFPAPNRYRVRTTIGDATETVISELPLLAEVIP